MTSGEIGRRRTYSSGAISSTLTTLPFSAKIPRNLRCLSQRMILAYSLDKIATLNASQIEQQTNFRYLLVNQQRFQSREPHCKSSPLRTRGASRSARDEFNAHMSTNGLPPSPSEITKEEREGRIPACLHSLPIVYFKPVLRIARPPAPALIALLSALITRLSVPVPLVGASLPPFPPSSLPSLLPFPRTEIIFWIGTSCCTECPAII